MDICQQVQFNEIIKFKSDATYVVTGGFGSLGKGLISWVIKKGACNIIVIGRSNLTDTNQKIIQEWQKQKIKIQLQITIFNIQIVHVLPHKKPHLSGFYPY